MPTTEPTVVQLARAGAMLHAAEVRRRGLKRVFDRAFKVSAYVVIGAALMVIGVAIVLVGASGQTRVTGTIAFVGVTIAMFALYRSTLASDDIAVRMGYEPSELAELVGYVEPSGDSYVLTELGETALLLYRTWPRAAGVLTG